jgi:hypothetical protein
MNPRGDGILSQQWPKAWVLLYRIANRSDSPFPLGEKVSAIHLAAAADSFGASEATIFLKSEKNHGLNG